MVRDVKAASCINVLVKDVKMPKNMILTTKRVGKHQFASQNMLQFTFSGTGISINFAMRLQKFLEFQGEERLLMSPQKP